MTNIKFEVKKQSEVDVALDGKTKVELSGLKQELVDKKNELLKLKTLEEANNFLKGLPILSNDEKGVFMVGDKFIQIPPSDPKYQEALATILSDIDAANTEIANSGLFKEVEEKVVQQTTAKEIQTQKQEVQQAVVDNTFSNAPVADQLEKNKAFQTFLTGKNDFEKSLEGYRNAQIDAFKTMLLSAMQ